MSANIDNRELTKVESYFYINLQLRVLWVKKQYILGIRTFAWFFTLLMIDYLYTSLVVGEVSLFSRGTATLEASPYLFWLGFTSYSLVTLATIWFGTIGTANNTKEPLVRRLLDIRNQEDSSPANRVEARYAIFCKYETDIYVVDTEEFTARDEIYDLTKNGYECKSYIEADSKEQALTKYKRKTL